MTPMTKVTPDLGHNVESAQSENKIVISTILSFLLLTMNQRSNDVEDIKYVINFDYPNSSEDYVHRIGRTGRKNKKGTAYTFFTKGNSKQANDLINVLKEANQTVNPKLLELSRFGGGPDKFRRYNTGRNGFIPKNSFNSGRGGGNGYNNSYGSSNGNGAGYPQKRKFDSFDAASHSTAKKPYYDSSYSSGPRYN